MRQRRGVSARAIAGAASAAAPMPASTPRRRKKGARPFTTLPFALRNQKRAVDDAPQHLRGGKRIGPREDRADDRDAVGARGDHLRRIGLGDSGDRAERQGGPRVAREAQETREPQEARETLDPDRRPRVLLVAGREHAADATVIDRLLRHRARYEPRS